eukprot:GHRQ01032111.1.p2 GENE.GHRQ01032111.1~~GHRQ01032111.1.p2  ORF type:complete len:119 (+),score=23.26 GHRQ01032111.1:201-557(+)
MAARRGLGITSKDMEASRLVFCFVKDSKPKRKVAIPVPDSYTWEQFLDQVKAKLKLSGVAEICFSSNGQQVRSVSELQDIDELCSGGPRCGRKWRGCIQLCLSNAAHSSGAAAGVSSH